MIEPSAHEPALSSKEVSYRRTVLSYTIQERTRLMYLTPTEEMKRKHETEDERGRDNPTTWSVLDSKNTNNVSKQQVPYCVNRFSNILLEVHCTHRV